MPGGSQTIEASSFSSPLYYVEDANTIHVEVYRPSEVTEVIGDEIKWQKKIAQTTSTGILSSFNALEIGKTYKINGYCYFDGASVASTQSFFAQLVHDSININGAQIAMVLGNAADRRNSTGFSEIFTATNTVLDFNVSSITNPTWLYLNWILEELPVHQVTTDWT